MGLSGRGSFSYDNKMGSLEYVTQEILKTQDDRVYSEAKAIRGLFSDVRSSLSDWSSAAVGYYNRTERNQSVIVSDLAKITGAVTGLPSVIERQTTSLIAATNRIESSIVSLSNTVSSVNDSVNKVNSSILWLSDAVKAMHSSMDAMSSVKVPEAPNVVFDAAPDYSNVLNGISDVITSIKDSISSFDGGVDVSALYPEFHRDMEKVKAAIGEMANSYDSAEGFDLDGFTNSVKGFVEDYASDMVTGFTDVLLPGLARKYSEFVTTFTEAFKTEFEKQRVSLVNAISEIKSATQGQDRNMSDFDGLVVAVAGPFANDVEKYLESIQEIQMTFQEATVDWLEHIDSKLSNSFSSLSTTVRRSGAGTAGLGDAIDSFDDVSTSTKTTGGTVSKIFDWLKNSRIGEYLSGIVGMFTFSKLTDNMDVLHRDTKMILQATGGTKSQALDLRSDINKNIANTYGNSTFSSDEREQALNDAIRSGAVSQRHLEQATEVSLAYNKLLGTTIDFSQGWAKSLLVTKTNADDYLEAVAVSIDDFSNKFFVSAESLQKAAERYADTARIFTTDMKSFSKAINSAIQLQAAQENANIQSMDIGEWMHRLETTSVMDWTEADINRLVSYGITDFVGFSDLARNDETAAVLKLEQGMRSQADQAKKNLNEGGMAGQGTLWMNQNLYGYESGYGLAVDADKMDDFFGALKDTSTTQAGNISDLKQRTQTVANNSYMEELTNIASALRDDKDSFLGRILYWLESAGISSATVGVVGGLLSGVVSNIGGKLLGKLGGKLLGKVGGKIGGKLLGSAATSAAGTAAEAAGSSALGTVGETALGSAGAAGVRGGLGKLFGSAGKALGSAGSTVGGALKTVGGALTWTPAGGAGSATLGAGGAMSAGVGLTVGSAALGAGMMGIDAYKGVKNWTTDEDSTGRKVWSGVSGAIFGSGKGIGEEGATAGDVAKNAGWNTAKGAAVGAAIGSIVPGIGTAIGAGIGAIGGLITGLVGGHRVADVGRKKQPKKQDVTQTPPKPPIELVGAKEPVAKLDKEEEKPFDVSNSTRTYSNAAGLNRYAFSDRSASKILENNTPIDHRPKSERTSKDFGISETDLSIDSYLDSNGKKTNPRLKQDSFNRRTGGVSDQSALFTDMDLPDRKTYTEEERNAVSGFTDNGPGRGTGRAVASSIPMEEMGASVGGHILDSGGKSGYDNVAKPIVNSIDTNMSAVLGYLERIAGKSGGKQESDKTASSSYPVVQASPTNDGTDQNVITNYHNISGRNVEYA